MTEVSGQRLGIWIGQSLDKIIGQIVRIIIGQMLDMWTIIGQNDDR